MMDINTKKIKKNAFRVTKERGITASRVRVPGGHLDAQFLSMIQEIAQTYGNGTVHLTSRQGFEIPGIPFSKRPAYYKGKGLLKGSYIRVGEADIQMSPYELYSYDAFHRGLHDDRRPVRDAALSLLDKNLLDSYVSRIRNTRNNLANLAYDEVLKLLGIVKDGYPSLAAVMAFSHYPQSYFPQFSVTAVVISGDKKGNEI